MNRAAIPICVWLSFMCVWCYTMTFTPVIPRLGTSPSVLQKAGWGGFLPSIA
jgi:hypothetical protein